MSSDLEDRLKRLEAEQARQDQELFDLRDLEEIMRLEKQLDALDSAKPVIESQSSEADISVEKALPETTVTPPEKVASNTALEDIELPEETKQRFASGYIICLLFNRQKPSEWTDVSGGGWRDHGYGYAYPSMEAAQARLKELKQRFPDYPIDIIKR